jgi:hypothetical protein
MGEEGREGERGLVMGVGRRKAPGFFSSGRKRKRLGGAE